MHFDEHWISEAQLQMTAALAMSVAHLDGEFIEVGVWQGASAIPIAKAIEPATLHLVDHWEGDKPEAGEFAIQKDLVERDNYGQCLENLHDAGVANTMIWKMDWRDFIQRWEKPISFVHIDASHTADEVADNIKEFLPYAVPGAVFCGDDYPFPQVQEGVWRHFPNPMAAERMWWVYL